MSQYKAFLSTLSIMYVDDSSDSGMNKIFFNSHFKNVFHFDNGMDALEAFEKDRANPIQQIDLIITDIQLPIMDGFSLIRKIKEFKTKVPIFIFTDNKSPNNVVAALKLRISNYIFKPLDVMDMISRIYDACFTLYEEQLIKHQKRQLEEYLEIIDQIAIISKTDEKGAITFVNDIFCDIAQYTREELIGQPHNIVRHPDMPKEAFKDLWETIKKGKTWKGKVKNKSKDGSSYNVHATISPIYGNDEKTITGYMAVRFLTTEDDEKQREFKNQVMQNMKEGRLKEVEFKKIIKDLEEKVHLLGNSEYLYTAYEQEKARTLKLNQQIGFYEIELKTAKQKGFDVANKFKVELIKSLNETKSLQARTKQMENAVIIIKNELDEKQKIVNQLTEENKKQAKRVNDLTDVIHHLETKIELLK